MGTRAWLDLLHAETCWLLGQAGLDVMILKGVSTTRWLFPEGGRQSVDVDVLVDPAGWHEAIRTLGEHGYRPVQAGFRDGEAAPHSLELSRLDPQQGAHVVDLHRTFPGIGVEPEAAFRTLWARRVPETIARVAAAFPDVTTRALVVALHAARTPGNPRTTDDLRHAVPALDLPGWMDVAALAADLDALPALRAGLERQEDAALLVGPLGLDDVVVPAEWELRSLSGRPDRRAAGRAGPHAAASPARPGPALGLPQPGLRTRRRPACRAGTGVAGRGLRGAAGRRGAPVAAGLSAVPRQSSLTRAQQGRRARSDAARGR